MSSAPITSAERITPLRIIAVAVVAAALLVSACAGIHGGNLVPGVSTRAELIAWYERRGYRLTGATLPFPFTETSGETTRDFHLVEMRKTLA